MVFLLTYPFELCPAYKLRFCWMIYCIDLLLFVGYSECMWAVDLLITIRLLFFLPVRLSLLDDEAFYSSILV